MDQTAFALCKENKMPTTHLPTAPTIYFIFAYENNNDERRSTNGIG